MKNNEVANTLHQWVKLYRNKKLSKIEGFFNPHRFVEQGNIKYKRDIYSLFPASKLDEIYKSQWVEVKVCRSIEEVTNALKEIFAPYLSEFPHLAESTNRLKRHDPTESNELLLLFQQRAKDNNIPYIGVGDHNKDNSFIQGKGEDLAIWLPIRLMQENDYENEIDSNRICLHHYELIKSTYVAASPVRSRITSNPISYASRIGPLYLVPLLS